MSPGLLLLEIRFHLDKLEKMLVMTTSHHGGVFLPFTELVYGLRAFGGSYKLFGL